MGFFKDFKEDLSQAVNELLPEEVLEEISVVNTLEDERETEDNIDKLVETKSAQDDNADEELLNALLAEEENILSAKTSEPEGFDDTEITTITKSTVITGNIESNGSLDIMGTIHGDVSCQGKLSVIGSVIGNCTAGDIYVGSKRLTGNISCKNSVKIGLGTVIIGDIKATEGTIAGAVKGDIDINGPIMIDSTAIIKGNIKAQSIQINKGAVIEGFCSLSASVDIDNIFE